MGSSQYNENYHLQENNAVATLDLDSLSIINITSLGSKSWKNLLMDPSNKDDGEAMCMCFIVSERASILKRFSI